MQFTLQGTGTSGTYYCSNVVAFDGWLHERGYQWYPTSTAGEYGHYDRSQRCNSDGAPVYGRSLIQVFLGGMVCAFDHDARLCLDMIATSVNHY
jgi:hypothetical protein